MGAAEQPNDAHSARSRRSDQRGTTIVEFTLIFTLFFLIVGFIVQGAFLFNAWLVSSNAVREAARLGAPCYGREQNGCNLDQVEQVAWNAAAGTDPSIFTPMAIVCSDDSTTPAVDTLLVTATYRVPVLAPFVGQLFSQNPIPITVESRMRLENSEDGLSPCPTT